MGQVRRCFGSGLLGLSRFLETVKGIIFLGVGSVDCRDNSLSLRKYSRLPTALIHVGTGVNTLVDRKI